MGWAGFPDLFNDSAFYQGDFWSPPESSGVIVNTARCNQGSYQETTWGLSSVGAWTTYTPTWTASTTNPTPGSSTLHGKYRIVGKTVEGEIYLQIAAGTGQGSGNWRFAIPFAPSGDRVPVLVHIENALVGYYGGVGFIDTNQYVDQIVFNGSAVLGGGSAMNANSKISIRFSYEIA